MTPKQLKRREYNLQRRYGIGIKDYDKILARQGGGCFICGFVPEGDRSLDVDHNHKTGRVRGVLCRYCNTKLLKHLRDNKKRAKGLVKYLSKAIKEDKKWKE